MIGYAIDLGTSSSSAFSFFSKLQMEFNEALSTLDFGDNVECVIALRVSGEISDFGFTGCDKVMYSKRKSLITVDLGIPLLWEKKSKKDIKRNIVAASIEAVSMMAEYSQSESSIVVSEIQLAEVKEMLSSFLGNGE